MTVDPFEFEDQEYGSDDERSWIGMALALGIILVLMISAFIWFVIRFDPLTDDFIDRDAPTATATVSSDEF